jgi:hypothetical protein
MGRRINNLMRLYRPGWHQIDDLPAPYDVICCFFPDHDGPARWPHPGLVKKTESFSGGEAEVHVFYGTSTLKEWRAEDLTIDDMADIVAIGLKEPTRFDMDNLLPLAWRRENFPSHRIIGKLNASCVQRLEDRLRKRACREM